MAVTVFIPGALRAEADGQHSLDVAAEPGADLRAVLREVARRHPRLVRRICDERGQPRRYVNIFIGDEECRTLSGVDTPIRDGSEIRVLPSVAGG